MQDARLLGIFSALCIRILHQPLRFGSSGREETTISLSVGERLGAADRRQPLSSLAIVGV